MNEAMEVIIGKRGKSATGNYSLLFFYHNLSSWSSMREPNYLFYEAHLGLLKSLTP